MRCRNRLFIRQTGVLAICLGLLCLAAVSSWAVLPWYANDLLTYSPASPGVNDAVTYDWSAVQAEIAGYSPSGWTLKNAVMSIVGPNSYLTVRQGTTNIFQSWYFPTQGIYNVTLTLSYATPDAIVDPSGGPASTVHTCIAPAVTYVTLPPVPAADAKKQADGAFVYLMGKVVTYAGPSVLYVEQDDRSSGIRVDIGPHAVTAGMIVDIKGTLQTDNKAERAVAVATLHQTGNGTVAALAMPNKSVGGVGWFYDSGTATGQLGVDGGVGLNNIGLLVRVCGKVLSSSAGVIYIDDGSGLSEGTGLDGMRIDTSTLTQNGVQPNQYVKVTGISTLVKTTQGIKRCVMVRSASDIVIESAPVIYLYRTDLATAQSYKALFDSEHLPTDLVNVESAGSVDFSKYSLIVVGWDTNTGSGWGTSSSISNIVDSNRPVMAIETGGATFFGKLSLHMGAPQVGYAVGNQVAAKDAASAIFHQPYSIGTQGAITVSSNASGWYGYATSVPGTVTTVGNMPGYTDRIMLGFEKALYLYWPFRDKPDLYTSDGKHLLVNAAWYAMR